MSHRLTAIIEREGDGYVALCPELDIASQGDTIEQARDNLREALELFFEAAPREEIGRRLAAEVFVTQLEVAGG
jgi:predicted RNase H-like HicB family nuclease